MEAIFHDLLRRVKAFTDDMEKIGVKVEVQGLRIELDIKGNDEEQTKGGDGDEKRTDAQS